MKRIIEHIFWEVPNANGYTSYHVGRDVSSITEHRAQGDGDRWFYDVEFTDGHMERLFSFTSVIFAKHEERPCVEQTK